MSSQKNSAVMWCNSPTQSSADQQRSSCCFEQEGSTIAPIRATHCSRSLTPNQQWSVKKTQVVGLFTLLGLGAGLWLVEAVLKPEIAAAYAIHVNLPVNRQRNESYESLVRRAEAVALETTQRRFYQNDQVTDVSITVVGQNQGEIAPVLSLKVSRPQWWSLLNICSKDQSASSCITNSQGWVKHFSDARVLLGFKDIAANAVNQTTPEQLTDSTSDQTRIDDPATDPSQSEDNSEDHGPQSPDAVIPVDDADNSQDSGALEP